MANLWPLSQATSHSLLGLIDIDGHIVAWKAANRSLDRGDFLIYNPQVIVNFFKLLQSRLRSLQASFSPSMELAGVILEMLPREIALGGASGARMVFSN